MLGSLLFVTSTYTLLERLKKKESNNAVQTNVRNNNKRNILQYSTVYDVMTFIYYEI